MLILAIPVFAGQKANTITTLVGGGSVQGTSPTAADVPGPTSVIEDSTGAMYVAAPYSRYVFSVQGSTISNFAGQGWGGYSGDGGLAVNAVLGLPSGLAIDSKGEIFIADYGNSRIRMIANGTISTVAGSGVKCAESTNTCGDGGPATSKNAKLNLPVAVAVDAAGNLYIADSNDNRIRFVNRTNSTITISGKQIAKGNIDTIIGTGNPCTDPTNGCNNNKPALMANLTLPSGIAVDAAGNIFVADTKDQMVREEPAGPNSNLLPFAGKGGACLSPTDPTRCGDGGSAQKALLRLPGGLGLDASGNVYIADSGDNKVRVVNTQASNITIDQVQICSLCIAIVAGTGDQGFGGDNGPSTSANLDNPQSVYIDSSGNQFVSDTGNQRVRQIINSTGVISTVVGGGLGDGNAGNAILAAPNDIVKDPSGNLFIADQANNRIRKVDTSLSVTTIAGNGSAGPGGDGSNPSNAQFNGPSSVALDQNGNVFIADSNNLVIRELSNGYGTLARVAGNYGLICSPTTALCGDGEAATSQDVAFAFPLFVTTDSSGNLIIADYFAHRVRAVNTQTTDVTIGGTLIHAGQIQTIAGDGVEGYTGDGGLATQAELNHPSAVAVDASGNVYICDQYNMRIRKVDTTGHISRYALDGVAHLGGNGGPALSGSMWNPLAIALDPAGNLYISGGNDSVVQLVDTALLNFGTVAGDPAKADQGGYSGDGKPATQAKLANVGVAVDASENLYIADFGNNRIRYVPLAPAIFESNPPMNFGTLPIGSTSNPLTVTIKGTGGQDATFSLPTITGTNPSDFAIQSNTCIAYVSPFEQCTINVTFTPSAAGPRKATLTLTYGAPGSPQTIQLSGSGPDFTISADPTSLTIQKGASGNSTITVAPIAGFNQTITFVCTGAPPDMQVVCPKPVTLDGQNSQSETLTINTLKEIIANTYTINVQGQSSPVLHSASITVTIPQ
jgi:sugar lactone lactonase YvrE